MTSIQGNNIKANASVAKSVPSKKDNSKHTHIGLKTGAAIGAVALPALQYNYMLQFAGFKDSFKYFGTLYKSAFKEKIALPLVGKIVGLAVIGAGIGFGLDTLVNKKINKPSEHK